MSHAKAPRRKEQQARGMGHEAKEQKSLDAINTIYRILNLPQRKKRDTEKGGIKFKH
jgi:hypothetical protein